MNYRPRSIVVRYTAGLKWHIENQTSIFAKYLYCFLFIFNTFYNPDFITLPVHLPSNWPTFYINSHNLQEDVPTPSLPTNPPNLLGPHVSWGIGLSSPNPDPVVLCSICIGGPISAGICFMVGSSVSERSKGSKLVETTGFPLRSPCSSASFSFSLIQPQGFQASLR